MRDAIAWSHDLLDAGGAGALPAPGRLRRRLHPGGGGGGRPAAADEPGIDVLDGLGVAGRQEPGPAARAAGRRTRGRSRARGSGCWRRSASSGWSGWRRAARRRRSGGGTRPGAWRSRRTSSPPTCATGRWPALVRVERDLANFRAALAWAEETDDAETGLRLAVGAALLLGRAQPTGPRVAGGSNGRWRGMPVLRPAPAPPPWRRSAPWSTTSTTEAQRPRTWKRVWRLPARWAISGWSPLPWRGQGRSR